MGSYESVGKNNDWCTPEYIFDALDVQFDLDVASPAGGPRYVPTSKWYSFGALEYPWFGFIWMNPPFGHQSTKRAWLHKFFDHGNGVALLPDRTSAPWWQEFAPLASGVLFVSPKIKFERVDGSIGEQPGTGTCLFAAGNQGVAALYNAHSLGKVFTYFRGAIIVQPARPSILAIDAAKQFGWAFGEAGTTPISGSGLFPKTANGSPAATFAGALGWTVEVIGLWDPTVIAIEAPLPGSFVQGKSNAQTATILTGLPAVIEAIAYRMKYQDGDKKRHRTLMRVNLASVRKHFIGRGTSRFENLKPAVMAKCRALGWVQPDDEDHSYDRSDALAIWSYVEANVAPKLTQPVDDLFIKSRNRG